MFSRGGACRGQSRKKAGLACRRSPSAENTANGWSPEKPGGNSQCSCWRQLTEYSRGRCLSVFTVICLLKICGVVISFCKKNACVGGQSLRTRIGREMSLKSDHERGEVLHRASLCFLRRMAGPPQRKNAEKCTELRDDRKGVHMGWIRRSTQHSSTL